MATADPTNVDVPGMKTAAQSFEGKSREISGQEQMVQSTITTLMSTWTGESAAAYGGAMNVFYEECATIVKILHNLSNTVQQSALEYERTHHQATSEATSFKNSVPTGGLSGF
jgi:WXG100 family type VII secretion target